MHELIRHTRPVAGRAKPAVLALLLLAGCGGGGGGGGDAGGGGGGGGGGVDVTVSGAVSYERVPNSALTSGLDYAASAPAPVRGAVVEAVAAGGGAVLASGDTDAQGNYSLSVPAQTSLFIRVRARSRRVGTPGWDFRVVDNTNGGAQYVLDGATFDSGASGTTRDLHAESGWDGARYAGVRSAAPFAILDVVYAAYRTVLEAAPDIVFPALDLNWSIDNVPADGDPARGQIVTTSYFGGEIYILGAQNNDTDEYDRHVIAHEWGHYFEDRFSRADSVGGAHSGDEFLDPRVAFSEGFGYAFAGIALADPVSHDSFGAGQRLGFSIDVENNAVANAGWYSEASVQSILYDLHDLADDGVDSLSLGFAPLLDVLVSAQRETTLQTTLFSFIPALKQANPASADLIDAIVAGQNIAATDMDELASTERNDAGSADVLPLYTALSPGAAVSVCSLGSAGGNAGFPGGVFNKLSNRRFLVLEVAQSARYEITAAGPRDSDPDMVLHGPGLRLVEIDLEQGFERFDSQPLLAAGRYVLEVFEDANVSGGNQFGRAPGRTCFEVRADPL